MSLDESFHISLLVLFYYASVANVLLFRIVAQGSCEFILEAKEEERCVYTAGIRYFFLAWKLKAGRCKAVFMKRNVSLQAAEVNPSQVVGIFFPVHCNGSGPAHECVALPAVECATFFPQNNLLRSFLLPHRLGNIWSASISKSKSLGPSPQQYRHMGEFKKVKP